MNRFLCYKMIIKDQRQIFCCSFERKSEVLSQSSRYGEQIVQEIIFKVTIPTGVNNIYPHSLRAVSIIRYNLYQKYLFVLAKGALY